MRTTPVTRGDARGRDVQLVEDPDQDAAPALERAAVDDHPIPHRGEAAPGWRRRASWT